MLSLYGGISVSKTSRFSPQFWFSLELSDWMFGCRVQLSEYRLVPFSIPLCLVMKTFQA